MIQARFEPTFIGWQREARRLLAAAVEPDRILWIPEGAAQDVLPGLALASAPEPAPAVRFTVPRRFVELARDAALHRSEQRWPLLYRLLWRIVHGERRLLEVESDDDVRQADQMAQAVRRDEHKMHAFVRFRKVETGAGDHYVAWHVPDHLIVERVAPFFADRFNAMRWSILTPDRSVHWDGRTLTFTAGVDRQAAPSHDDLEDLWRTYYRSIFNPARVNLDAMRAELPARHWATLPEMQALPELLREAPRRVQTMLAEPAGAPSARPFVPDTSSLDVLRAAAPACRGCDLHARATQVVFGEGPPRARVMLVGEQPGDQEDVAGAPFVGPAGEVLQRAMALAGLERGEVYLTNAVKHFKWEPRGKRHIHQTPRLSEVRACRPWLEAEIALVSPAVVVCLGSTAAQALMGPQFRITRDRGQLLPSPWATHLVATYHPSAVLRADTQAHSDEVFQMLTHDLSLARTAM